MSGTGANLQLVTATVGEAQVIGLPRGVRKSLGEKDVFEVWVPSSLEDRAFDVLSRLTCEVALAKSESGVVRAARRLGISGTEKLAEAGRDDYWSYREREQLSLLLQAGWNASLETLQVFSGSESLWTQGAGGRKGVAEGLFSDAVMVISCAHDGLSLQLVVLSGTREEVWDCLIRGASVCGFELEEVTETGTN